MTKNVPGHVAGEGSGPIKQHQMIARGGSGMSSEDFGVQSMAALSRGNGYAGSGSKYLGDSARGAGKPVKHTQGKYPAQAAPDHGPTY